MKKNTPIPYEYLEDEDVSDEIYALIEKKTQEAEEDIQKDKVNVNFRWGREQLSVVKKVAQEMDIPYQTYIKQVVFRQSLKDLKEMNLVLKGVK